MKIHFFLQLHKNIRSPTYCGCVEAALKKEMHTEKPQRNAHVRQLKSRYASQFHQTIYHALGIDLETNYIIEERPFYTTPDGKGNAELDLLKT